MLIHGRETTKKSARF